MPTAKKASARPAQKKGSHAAKAAPKGIAKTIGKAQAHAKASTKAAPAKTQTSTVQATKALVEKLRVDRGLPKPKKATKVKLPSTPSPQAKQFLARLRKELRAVKRRADKFKLLDSRYVQLKQKRDSRPTGEKPDRRAPVDPEVKLLQAEVRRLMDEAAQAVTRVVGTRQLITIGTVEHMGKIDLVTDERAFRPKLTVPYDKESQALARWLFESLDSSLHELEQAQIKQYSSISALRQNVVELR